MTDTYKSFVHSCIRKYWFPERERIEITDDINPKVPYMTVRWAMITPAEISLHGNEALLRQNGKEFKATILEPLGAVFEKLSTMPEDPRPDENLNEGTSMLAANIHQEEIFPFTIRVVLTPYDTMLTSPGTTTWGSLALNAPVFHGVLPNPVIKEALCVFDLPEEEKVSLELYTLNGQLAGKLYEGIRPAGRNTIRIQRGIHAAGVYLLRLKYTRGAETTRVIFGNK
jgi:hypothetical protein